MSVTATTWVATERGERYRKRLASHFGNKIEVAEDPSGTVLRWWFGGTTTPLDYASASMITNAPTRLPGSPILRTILPPPAARDRPEPRAPAIPH